MIGLSIILLIPLIVVAFVLTIIWQGEYIYRRLFTIGMSLIRKGIGQNAVVELKDWQEEEEGVQLEDHERATIHMEGSILAGQN